MSILKKNAIIQIMARIQGSKLDWFTMWCLIYAVFVLQFKDFTRTGATESRAATHWLVSILFIVQSLKLSRWKHHREKKADSVTQTTSQEQKLVWAQMLPSTTAQRAGQWKERNPLRLKSGDSWHVEPSGMFYIIIFGTCITVYCVVLAPL